MANSRRRRKCQLPDPPSTPTDKNRPERNILVLATGGTLCMKPNENGAYEPVPDYIPELLRGMRSMHDAEYCKAILEARTRHPNTLVLPSSRTSKVRIVYTIHEYSPLIDSSNMQISDYRNIANDIQSSYNKYDGFVILHGTDTLAYTASTLSFMFENLSKPVVLTGAQVPAGEMRTDAFDNILGALVCTGQYQIPEVTVFFNRKLFRGNRVVKKDADDFDGFNSPNMKPLLTMGIKVQQTAVDSFDTSGGGDFSVVDHWNAKVGLLRLFPAITVATVRSFLTNVDGLVLETYGAGNGPSERKEILAELRGAAQRGVIIVNVTQCHRGAVNSAYAAGRELEKAGVIGGRDLTVEAALAKLSYVCGMKDKHTMEKQRLIAANLRGELTVPMGEGASQQRFVSAAMGLLKGLPRGTDTSWHTSVYAMMLCTAAREGNLGMLKQLRRCGANYNDCDYDKRTALHIAAAEGNLKIIKELVEHGASLHAVDRYGQTALWGAVEHRHSQAIAYLVNSGSRLSQNANSTTAMCRLAADNDLVGIRAWIEAGANPNRPDYDGRTVLHVAALNGHREMCQYLMLERADPQSCDTDGNNCLHYAGRSGDHATIKLFCTVVPAWKQFPNAAKRAKVGDICVDKENRGLLSECSIFERQESQPLLCLTQGVQTMQCLVSRASCGMNN